MSDPGIFLIALVAFFFLVAVIGAVNARRQAAAFREKLRKGFGEKPGRNYAPEELARIPRYFEKHTSEEARAGRADDGGKAPDGAAGKAAGDGAACLCERFVVDDITANDLDLWSLFARMNYCRSAAGEEALYHMLRTPCVSPAALFQREQEMAVFAADGGLRLDLQEAFAKLGGSGKYSVYDYLDTLSLVKKKSNLPHILGIAALALSLMLLPAFFTYGFPLLLCAAVYQIISYYRAKGESDAYLSTFAYVLRLIRCGEQVEKLLSAGGRGGRPASKVPGEEGRSAECGEEAARAFAGRCGRLRAYTEALRVFRRGASVLMSASRMSGSGNPLDILADYVRMLLHIDLIKFNQMVREAGRHTEEIDALITVLGETEALLSIVCYRASLPAAADGVAGWCVPEFAAAPGDGNARFAGSPDPGGTAGEGAVPAGAEEELTLSVEALRHALLEEGAVANSMTAGKSVLLTGSNASGKSTWLKALGLAALMAQTAHTVTAASYRAPLFRIYSSMALADDLQGGESYYIVEIRALARVLDAAKKTDAPPVLAFIDEVLRGTNTVERIAASAQILAHFGKERALLFAATHDLELASLLAEAYDNYHFEGVLTEGDVRFDYRLKEGPSRTRNAIGLLRRFSYDRQITERAEAMAKRFADTGVWSMEAGGMDAAAMGDGT